MDKDDLMSRKEMKKKKDCFDFDMLSEQEIIELGVIPPSRRDTKQERCHFCGRKIAEPIYKFEKFGYDFIPHSKAAHKGCVLRHVREVTKIFKQAEV